MTGRDVRNKTIIGLKLLFVEIYLYLFNVRNKTIIGLKYLTLLASIEA